MNLFHQKKKLNETVIEKHIFSLIKKQLQGVK